jgi:hypothetical protein
MHFSLIAALLMLTSARSTLSHHPTLAAYLAPTRLEILMTVEQGIHHRVLFAKTRPNAHGHGFSA